MQICPRQAGIVRVVIVDCVHSLVQSDEEEIEEVPAEATEAEPPVPGVKVDWTVEDVSPCFRAPTNQHLRTHAPVFANHMSTTDLAYLF